MLTLEFDEVTVGGPVQVISPAPGINPPAGFRFGWPAVSFELDVNAQFNNKVHVCVRQPFGGEEDALHLFHFELGEWRDITATVETVAEGYWICGFVTSFSPFALMSPNHAPVAAAGVDQTVHATSPTGAWVTLDGRPSSDPDGDELSYAWRGPFGVVTTSLAAVQLPAGAHTIALSVDDGFGLVSADTVTIVVVPQDTTPPSIDVSRPSGTTYGLHDAVIASYSCTDAGSGIASCTGPVPSGDEIDTSMEGTHAFTVTAVDRAGNQATRTVTYTVVGEEGRMTGESKLADSRGEHHFQFRIAERSIGDERGKLKYSATIPKSGKQKAKTDTFESMSIGPVAFWDDPSFRPTRGRRPRPTTDSATFAGTGTWNGVKGYTFEARATDEGEPGRGRDEFEITIRDSKGTVVAAVGGKLTSGNIQSLRLGERRHEKEEKAELVRSSR